MLLPTMNGQNCGYVYMVKLDQPMGGDKHKAQYYIGWTLDTAQRLADHKAGRGSAMLRAAAQRGIPFEIVATVPGDRALERWLKNKKDSRAALRWMQKQVVLCPCCHREVIHAGEGICWYCAIDAQHVEQESPDQMSKNESDRVATV